MNTKDLKVYIKLAEIGDRKKDVLLVLSKIQGLRGTPERLVANVPCYISGKVPRRLAEKVQKYLQRAGAFVELEEEGLLGDEEQIFPVSDGQNTSSSMFESSGFPATALVEEPGDSEFSEDIRAETGEMGIVEFETDVSPHTPVVSSSHRSHVSPSDTRYTKESAYVTESELVEPAIRKRPRERKKQKKWIGPGILLLVVVLIAGGVWMYFSGKFSKLSHEYDQNPVVGQVGILDIENPQQAELSLHHVIGTRVTPEIPLEGSRALLRRGDYYVEARHGSQVVHFPVYIKGRGHRIELEVEFPPTSIPVNDVAYIPPGWFRMGNKETTVAHFGFPDETPDIDIYVDGFFLAKYEVTNREFAEFIEAGGYENDVYWERLLQDWPSLLEQVPSYERVYGNDGWNSVRKYIHAQFINTDDRPGPRLWEDDTPPYEYGQDDRPVFGITLYEAEAYCQWMTQKTGTLHRLPTEAEWEKAARGYEGYFFSYGNEYDPARANTESEGPKNVGSYPPNSYGVYDLTGNVWEWVSDHYSPETYQFFLDKYRTEIRNPHMLNETHRYDRVIVRGGSFRSVNRINARTPVRYPMFPNYWHTNIGFRYVVVP